MAGVESRVGGVQRLRSPDLSAPQDPLFDSLGTGCHSWNRDQPITLSHKAAPCMPLASRATHASHCHQPPVCDSTFAGSLPLQHHPFSLAASVVPTPSRTSEPPIDAWPHPRLIYLISAGLLAPRWSGVQPGLRTLSWVNPKVISACPFGASVLTSAWALIQLCHPLPM